MNIEYVNIVNQVVSSDLAEIARAWRRLQQDGVWPNDSIHYHMIWEIKEKLQEAGIKSPPDGVIGMNIIAAMKSIVIDKWLVIVGK